MTVLSSSYLSILAQDILPNVYSLGFKTGQTLALLIRSLSSLHWQTIYETVLSFPILYKDWWLNLVAEDPIHVAVETTLLISLVYILLVSRFIGGSDSNAVSDVEKLTSAEEQQLLAEWKQTRAPLTPESYSDDDGGYSFGLGRSHHVIVHEQRGRTMQIEIVDNINTPKENNDNETTNKGRIFEVLNMSTFDFWGMNGFAASTISTDTNTSGGVGSNDAHNDSPTSSISHSFDHAELIKRAANDALDRYGCGACGPRGFYGTVDVHLQLEQCMAQVMQTEASILYSDGASTLSSTVAAFCKRGDLIVADEAISEPLRTGVLLSRAHVKWFPHNDIVELKRILEKLRAQDQARKRPPNAQRRFLIVEGLYKTTGQICRLPEIVQLKHDFAYRLILDESCSFGTLGPTGKGVLELFGKQIQKDAEIVTVSLEHAVGCIGGVTVGTQEVVEHQRLCGAGYCFSASSPPFSATAAMTALHIMETRSAVFQCLRDNVAYMYSRLMDWCSSDDLQGLMLVTSDDQSPIVMLQVADIPETQYLNEAVFLEEVVRECLEHGIALTTTTTAVQQPLAAANTSGSALPSTNTVARTITAGNTTAVVPLSPAIRMIVTAVQTPADLDLALEVLKAAIHVVMTRFHEDLE